MMEIEREQTRNASFWISLILRLCLIGGLSAFILSTFIPTPTSDSEHVVPTSEAIQPALSLRSPQAASIKQGQTLRLHGEHFGAHHTISFLLDATTPLGDEKGKPLSLRASTTGSFDVRIPVRGSIWSAELHYIAAVDIVTGRGAYFTLVVQPARPPQLSSRSLALSKDGKPVKELGFHATVGQAGPDPQLVTLTNTSGSSLRWQATATAASSLSWLVIDDNHIAGDLNSGETVSIGISVLMAGLKRNPPQHPYTGQIVFTINGQEELLLTVELQVVDGLSELVFSPDPIVGLAAAGKTCQPSVVTLLNLGQSFIDWTLVPYYSTPKDRIQFIVDGNAQMQGVLTAVDTPGDTQLLQIHCTNVTAGNTFKFTLYANSSSQLVTIFIT